MVARGRFFLYDSIVPALEAGRYRLRGDIDIAATDEDDAAAGALPVEPLQTHFNVTAPRLSLPPDQALLTYPPANAEGAFEARLPQIVLKKRTLPWDRKAAPDGTSFSDQTVTERTPWLALVLIAEGEGQIEHDIPWQDCVTEGVDLPGDKDVPNATRLSVPASIVSRVFPTVDDLTLLTHVREVNLDDTEAAMGDDDGFLAVVIANRTPQFDRENCRPKAYTACLINLEGQLAALPAPLPPRLFFEMADLVLTAEVQTVASAIQSGAAVPIFSEPVVRDLDRTDAEAMSTAIRRGDVFFHDGMLMDRAGRTADGMSNLGALSGAALLDGDFSGLAPVSTGQTTYRVTGSFDGFAVPVGAIFQEQILRFPVLTSWRFTCTGAGSFEQLMRNLDVGLLGHRTGGGYARPLADCVDDPVGEASDAPPPTRMPLVVAESGHLSLPYRTRIGTDDEAWYRGPFSPVRLLRDLPGTDGQALAHISDHLRMMTPQGIEDVSLAVAFETGRLLALSQPSFIAALRRWRAERFGAARARSGLDFALIENLGLFVGVIEDPLHDGLRVALDRGHVAREIEAGLVRALGAKPAETIAGLRPRVDPGNPIPALDGDLDGILADGLNVDRDMVSALRNGPADADVVAKLQAQTPRVAGAEAFQVDDRIQTRLVDTLDRGVAQLAQFAVGKDALERDELGEVQTFDDLDLFLKSRLKDLNR